MIDGEVFSRKRINNISEIYDGKKLIITEFINLDLSNLDLSNIPMEQWEGCLFYNTSFKNTGIKFIPNKLKETDPKKEVRIQTYPRWYSSGIYINFCDFSDNDLTYLGRKDFTYHRNNEVFTYGCNFKNTHINYLVTLENLILDSSYSEFDYDYWGFNLGFTTWPKQVDIFTIIKNPFLNIPSSRFFNALGKFVFDCNREEYKSNKSQNFNFSDEYKVKIVNLCEQYLEYDKQGYAKRLYYEICKNFSINDKFDFFRYEIKNQYLTDIDLSGIPGELLRFFHFKNNIFENVTLNNSLNELLVLSPEAFLDFLHGYENEYKSLYLPRITYSDWQDNKYGKKRISGSAITFFTKVYLELSRVCNANCLFCRNNSFDNCKYDLEKIKQTIYQIKSYVNALVIGGGEPTLRLDDVKELHECFLNSELDWHMFSNGTNPSIINDDYIMDNFKLNISRHAVSDLENANIFRVDSNKIMSSKDIERLNIRNEEVTLNAVCFKGGLDSFDKIIDYIKFAREIGCKKVLIQDLQKNMSLGNNNAIYNDIYIDDRIFSKVIEYLRINGYKEKYPIYATGGYVSYIFKNKEGFSVTLQSYINKDELNKEWVKAVKRAFDLSIAPNGDLYENWSQTTGLVKKLKK